MTTTDEIPRRPDGGIDFDFRPTTLEQLGACLSDPMWRICSGFLYKIIVKGDDDDDDGLVMPFRPNRAQRRFLRRLWHRNVILKARQLGFTTLIAVAWLDHALFNPNARCGIVAQDEGAAKVIFRDKVKFAYRNLPDAIRERFPLEADNADELLFAHNNSSIRVATSMRSGTIHRLHVSEFGKICAKYPDKAAEVIKGSIPSVPLNGITVIESTAEGREGDFYSIVQKAGAIADEGRLLNPRDYRLHFFAWHDNDLYRMSPEGVTIGQKLADYFTTVEASTGKTLDDEQRAWYAATLDGDFSGDMEAMRQEYPSTRDEPFQVSTEGCWLTMQMAAARKSGRICKLPALTSQPCWTFWDIGNSDGMAVWVIQKVGQEYRCVAFNEWWGEPYAAATNWLQSLGLMWEAMYLPHDADHERQGQTINKTPRQMLEALMPGVRFEVVPRIDDVTWGIQQLRDAFPLLWFDAEACKEGIAHLDMYRKKWNKTQATWSDIPDKSGGHSEAADALRQFGQAYANGQLNVNRMSSKIPRRGSWRTA